MSEDKRAKQTTLSDEEKGLPNIGPADVYWTGIAGEIDPHKLLSEFGFDPHGPLELLLHAIIAANPDNRPAEERLNIALEALVTKPKPIGRPPNDDYKILLEIAWRYHELAFKGTRDIEIAPIIRECLSSTTKNASATYARLDEGENKEIRRLKRQFEKQKDLLLARVTAEMDHDRMDFIRAVKRIALELQRLGVKLDISAIKPRLRRSQNPS